jgi:hypothetical protein
MLNALPTSLPTWIREVAAEAIKAFCSEPQNMTLGMTLIGHA